MDYYDFMEDYGYHHLDMMLYGKPLPDYYDTMYKDGYTPQQILEAVSRSSFKHYMEQQRAQQKSQEEISSVRITSEVKVKK